MWRVLIVLPSVLLALAADAPAAVSRAADQPPEPIATRQTIFSIPYQIEKASVPSQEPVEVDLYVSTDRGTSWRSYAKVEPSQGYFLFRAVGDGEYWFLVRTLDRMGQLKPQGPPRPELRVLVDTTPPSLQLDAARGDAGQIVTQWKIGELALDRKSLKIQYRTDTDATWRSVAIDWRDVRVEGPLQSGKVVWWPPSGARRLEIRAEVSDLAGNAAVSHQQVSLKPSDGAPAGPELKDPINATAQRWRPAKRGQAEAQWTGTSASGGLSEEEPPAAQHSDLASPSSPATIARYPQTRAPGAGASPLSGPASDSVAGSVSPAIQNQYVVPNSAAESFPRSWPAGVRPRMVNSRVFELEYEAPPANGPSTGPVQLWGTRDGGRSWQSYGQDADGRSPILVSLAEEGVYGFRVTAQADPRQQPAAPAAGQRPDIWVCIDLSQPACRIVSAEPASSGALGGVVIRWEAADRMMLAPRPVSLFYRDLGGGGWAPIAAGLENTGSYLWKTGPETPGQVYLRLEVRDAAGNLAVFESPQPIPTRTTR